MPGMDRFLALAGPGTVSYTHLAYAFLECEGDRMSYRVSTQVYSGPVSYTHLDVYKRQYKDLNEYLCGKNNQLHI